jgi:hypothetical protein
MDLFSIKTDSLLGVPAGKESVLRLCQDEHMGQKIVEISADSVLILGPLQELVGRVVVKGGLKDDSGRYGTHVQAACVELFVL